MRNALVVALMLSVSVGFVVLVAVVTVVATRDATVTYRDKHCAAWQETGQSDENGHIVMRCVAWATPAP